MANGYRITAIVLVIFSFLVIYYGSSSTSYVSDSIQEKQYTALANINGGVAALFFVALAIFFLLMGYTKEHKKK